MIPIFISTWRWGRLCSETALAKWQETNNLIDAVEAGIAAVELDPSVNSVGYGGIPNAEGEVELDGAIMRGDTLAAGAVAGVRHIVPVISVARKVMEETPHVMLVGESAERFALSHGFKPRPLLTQEALRRWEEWNKAPRPPELFVKDEESHDTVCLLGMVEGKFIAGCATSGIAWKQPGRVGDSPIIGAGLYADDEVGAAAATGIGEEIWRFVLSYCVVQKMRMGLSAQEACVQAVQEMLRRKPENRTVSFNVIALDKNGGYGAAASKDNFLAPVLINGIVDDNPVPQVQDL